MGCDEKWIRGDPRVLYVADNRRVLRAIDLRRFTIFDLDSWGDPFECAVIIADRRPIAKGETIGIVLTDGTGASMIGNRVARAAAELAGLNPGQVGLLRNRDAVINRAVIGLAKRCRADIVKRWEAHGRSGGKHGQSQLRYIGLVLRGA